MTLSPAANGVLDAVAEAIAKGRQFRDEGLYDQLYSGFGRNKDAILSVLTERVLHHSELRWTVRETNPDLFFEDSSKGFQLNLLRCPASTPDGLVTELTDHMTLFVLGPYSNGYAYDCKRATIGQIRSRQQKRAAEADRRAAEVVRKQEEAVNEAAAAVFMTSLIEVLSRRLASHPNAGLRKQVQGLSGLSTDKQLPAIIGICAKLDITIQELVLDTVS